MRRLEVQPVRLLIEIPFVGYVKLLENIVNKAIGIAGDDRAIDSDRHPETQATIGAFAFDGNLNRAPPVGGQRMDDASFGVRPTLHPCSTGCIGRYAAKRQFGGVVIRIACADQKPSVEP